MLEIIALVYLSKKNGALAERKGLKSGKWILFTVLAWFGFELFAGILAFIILGQENFYGAYFIALGSAVGGYFFIRSILNKKPDDIEEDINKIGVSDLYPENHKS